jgi:hypothetical protein
MEGIGEGSHSGATSRQETQCQPIEGEYGGDAKKQRWHSK